MIVQNSELQKYYWQSFSLQRFVAMPAVILALTFLVLHMDEDNPFRTLSGFAYQGYYLVVFLWGGYQAANALVQEVKENTWDNQRLSSVSPLALTIGKLFGSTMYTWYGGVMLLIVFAYASLQVESTNKGIVLYNLLMLVGTGLLGQAVALLSSLVPLRMQASRDQFHLAGYFIFGLIVSGVFLSYGSSLAYPYRFERDFTEWFGAPFSEPVFFLGSLFIFLLWTLWAIYRFMRDALQFKNTPAVWASFVVFCMVYVAGFSQNNAWMTDQGKMTGEGFLMLSGSGIAFSIGLLSTYLSFFSENLNMIRYRALFHHWQHRSWKKLLHLLPMWMVSFGLAVLAGGMFLIASLAAEQDITLSVITFTVSILLFTLRDACIFHYFTLAPNGRFPLLAALFYLGILYLLIPNILIFAFGSSTKQIGHIFYPMFIRGDGFTLLLVILELALVAWLLKRRYHKINALMEQ